MSSAVSHLPRGVPNPFRNCFTDAIGANGTSIRSQQQWDCFVRGLVSRGLVLEEELLWVTHVLACAQPLSGPRSREQPLDVVAPVRAWKQRVAPSTAFAVYFEEQLSSTDDSLSQQDAMCLLAER